MIHFCHFLKFKSVRNIYPVTSNVIFVISSVQSFSRVRLCDPMDCSAPGLPVHHQHPELTQNHVCWVGDVIQPSHPLSSPSSPAFNLSQHQGLYNTSYLNYFLLGSGQINWVFRSSVVPNPSVLFKNYLLSIYRLQVRGLQESDTT